MTMRQFMRYAVVAAAMGMAQPVLAQDTGPSAAVDGDHKSRGSETGEPAGKAAAVSTPAVGSPLSVEDTLLRLRDLNVTYSVSEAQLRDWLGNAEYTPYPAIASALIVLLRDRRLAKALDLDVIVYNYESAPGARSPRRPEDIDQAVMVAAILKGFNERYGSGATELSQVTE